MPSLTSRKSSSFLTALHDFERGDGVARACGIITLVLIAASFVLDLIVVMDFSRPYQIAQFSQDEYWFLEEILRLQGYLINFDWQGIRSFGSPFAYGFPFWLIAAVVALPLQKHVLLMTLFLRLVSVVLKYTAFYIIYRRVLALTQKPLLSLLAMVLLLVVPAFVFDGKIIGPEFFILFLIALGWSSLLSVQSKSQFTAAFCFVLAALIKFNVAPLMLIFIPAFIAAPVNAKGRVLINWTLGAIIPLVLFLVPENPLKEILAVGATHRVDYGWQYLYFWYAYDALELDDMLKGGWGVDFVNWPLFIIMLVYVIWQTLKLFDGKIRNYGGWSALILPVLICTFFAAVITCFAISMNSLMHPWFVFAPFLLLLASSILLIGAEREGTIVLAVFLVAYIFCFGGRYVFRWEHRIDKFEAVATSEPNDAVVSAWIAENCPNAREGIIDYNLIWPPTYNGHLQNMWTLIQVEDFRRANGSAQPMMDKVDLMLLKLQRVGMIAETKYAGRLPASALGNFFADGPPYFLREHDFQQLSVYAREGVCRKQGK